MSGIGSFGEADLARIRQAVADAEARSGGEIVAYIVGQADEYPEAAWQGGASGGLLGLALVYLLVEGSVSWGSPPFVVVLLGAVVGVAVGWGLFQWVGPLKRWAAGGSMSLRVASRAEQAFLEEEVFATSGRTGVLVFIALFERRVVILADTGLHEAVPEETWETLADGVARDLARGPDPGAVVAGVGRVGEALAAGGVIREAADRNEIPDEPRVRDR